ncbi:MAG: hypothetical protein Q7S92_04480 [Candidatus Diapherotrites archaeon]|nr:hypothetical protein [Candidatus Diapherotrites archaeon]
MNIKNEKKLNSAAEVQRKQHVLPTRTRVAIDTNMLLSVSQLKLDIFQEVVNEFGEQNSEIAIPDRVLNELKKLAEIEKNKDAILAQAWLNQKKFKVLKAQKADNADKALLELAKQGFIIATNDKVLRKSIKNVNGKSIYIRKRKVLDFSETF